jgi:hypothetical protein
MKTVMVTFSGTATEGDLVALTYTTPRGGASNARYVVRGGDTPDKIASEIAMDIMSGKGEYGGGAAFGAVAKGPVVMVTCSDTVSDASFYATVSGAGTEEIQIDTF